MTNYKKGPHVVTYMIGKKLLARKFKTRSDTDYFLGRPSTELQEKKGAHGWTVYDIPSARKEAKRLRTIANALNKIL